MALAGCSASDDADIGAEPGDAVARGQAWYVTCQGCHGNEGEGLAGMHAPRLAGLSAQYIERQLMHYRSGVRGGPEDFLGVAMNGRAKALGEDRAVSDVAAYIATLPHPGPVETADIDPALLALGKDQYESCVACHGAKGEGNADMLAPPLAGTDAAYLARQLTNFREGIRGREGDAPGQQMRAAAQVLPDEAAVEAVAAYASTLR